jgi:Tfp pilus assembly protein PilX
MNVKSPHRQRGVVLVVSLIMLLVVTLLAVSSMQGTVRHGTRRKDGR